MRAALLCAAAAAGLHAAAGAVVNTTYGPVSTTATGNGVTIFRSVRFGAPPVGANRFRAPQPPTPWTDVVDTTNEPNSCPQLKLDGNIFVGNEDCLFLSVYVPDGCTPENPCPVAFWIFGGAWILGDATEFGWYEGTYLTTHHDVVLVSPNYRVGPFGFMALNSLQHEDPNNSTGNAGLQDQTAALRWVRDNIAAFGGDASRVTIFGESAGGFSVCWHLVNRNSAGLFSGAVMESGSCDTPQFFVPLQEAVAFNQLYSGARGCNGTVGVNDASALACMRSLSTEDVMESVLDWLNPNWPFVNGATAQDAVSGPMAGYFDLHPATGRQTFNVSRFAGQALNGSVPAAVLSQLPALAPIMPWAAAIDGSPAGLTDLPLRVLQSGNFNKVPVMLGSNKNEGTIFMPLMSLIVKSVPLFPLPLPDAALADVIEHALDMFPAGVVDNATELILANYPIADYPLDNNWSRGSDILTHMFFACAARRTARTLTSFGIPVFLYQFSYHLSFFLGAEYALLGNYHTSELYFVWGNQWPPLVHEFTADDWEMTNDIQGYWTNFMRSRNPNIGTSNVTVQWPQYDAGSDMNMQLELPLGTTYGLLDGLCDMWDQVASSLNNTVSAKNDASTKASRRFFKAHGASK